MAWSVFVILSNVLSIKLWRLNYSEQCANYRHGGGIIVRRIVLRKRERRNRRKWAKGIEGMEGEGRKRKEQERVGSRDRENGGRSTMYIYIHTWNLH